MIHPPTTHRVNTEATVRLATLAKEAGVPRFLFASSCSVYGASPDGWVNEEDAPAPVTPYGRSKLEAEKQLLALCDESFCAVFLRKGTAYGYSPAIRFDLVLNNFVGWALHTGRIHLKSDGAAWRPLVHVADLARAYVEMLEIPAERIRGEAYNIGETCENYQVSVLADRVAALLPECRIVEESGAPTDLRTYRVNCSKWQALVPDFATGYSLDDGLRDLIARLRHHPVPPSEFERGRFSRLHSLQHQIDTGILSRDLL
jgi:nucleoside-diphosphate-sugar epimerase